MIKRLLPLLLFALPAAAGDIERGRVKSAACAQCHGAAGEAPIADYPILAGQNEKYLAYTLRAYRSGARQSPLMAGQMLNLSDGDIADLAAFYAAQESPLR